MADIEVKSVPSIIQISDAQLARFKKCDDLLNELLTPEVKAKLDREVSIMVLGDTSHSDPP